MALLLAVVTLLTLAGLTTAQGAVTQGAELRGRGYWSLRDLGSGDLKIPLSGHSGQGIARFDLPQDARQGPDTWYLVRLHAGLELRSNTGNGLVYISALTNGRASNQIEVEVQRDSVCGVRLRWSVVDLLTGYRAREVCGPSIDLETTNFAQYRGIRPGSNALAFRIERIDDIEVDSVRIFPDSGISVSGLGPAKLRFEPVTLARVVHPGTRFNLPFILRNVGDRPARNVKVGLEPVPGLDRPRARTHWYEVIAPHSSVEGVFSVKARRPGYHSLTIGATSTANRPAIELELPVLPRTDESGARVRRWALIGGLGLIGAGLIIVWIGRRWRGKGSPR